MQAIKRLYFDGSEKCLSYLFIFAVLLNINFANSLSRRDYSVHAGKNLTIPCKKGDSETILWTRDGNNISSNVNDENSLVFTDITSNEAGLYVCSVLKNTSSDMKLSYQPHFQAHVKVKTKPGAVGSFRARATTIIAVLIWEVWRNRTGNAPIIDFTAEMRKQPEIFPNNTEEDVQWQKLDPQHIAPNARQLEVYHLVPNTSYQFRIWASNEVGSGDVYTIGARTVAPTEEKDLIMRILEDAKEFKKEYWIIAVAIVMGTLLILTIGTTLILWKECRESSEDEFDKDLVQNMHVILNPGFCQEDDQRPLSPIKTHFHGYGNHYNDDYEKDMTFSRKMSIFFTGNTIKRI